MAEKTVSVRLAARVDSYIAAMKAAEAATTNFSRATKRNLATVGTQMQTVGRSMTMFISAPLVAAGGFAVKMASDFETAFAQMVGLANVPASEVDHLRESVLSLAGETARSPQELADALYLAASSGLDSAAAMDVVTMAAHGAAAGLGTTDDVVRLLTGAIGSYGSANITASEAIDVLTAAVRDGRAEPEEMAQTMGRILPVAAQMGVSFGQVGGALAFLTNTGIATDQAVTGLRAALINLYVPGKQARDILETMGTSSDELKAAIDRDGLMGALELLRDHGFDGNVVALRKLLPEVRGLNVMMPLLADETHTLDGIMDDTTHAAGSLGDAFGAVADTDAFKMKQAFADLKVSLIEIGDILLPVAASMASGLSDMLEMFNSLPGPAQAVVVAFGALAAVIGPLVFIAGSFVKNFVFLRSTMETMSGGLSTAAKAFGLLGIGIAAGLYIFDQFGESQRNVHARTAEVSDALEVATTDAWTYATAAAGARDAVDPLTVAQIALSNALTGNTEGGMALTQALGALGLQTEDAWAVTSGLYAAMNEGTPEDYAKFWMDLGTQIGLTGDQLTLFAGVMGGTMPMTHDQLENAATAAGFADGEFDALTGHAQDLASAIGMVGDVPSLATTFLNDAAAGSELGANLVKLAQAQADAAGEGDNTVAVYENFQALLPGLTDAQWDLVMGLDATAEAATGAGQAAADSTTFWGQLWTGIGDGAVAVVAGMKVFTGTVDDAFAHLEGGIHNAAEAQDALAKIAALGPAGENWVRYAESTIDASRSGSEALLVYQTLMHFLDSSNPAFGAFVANQLHLEGAFRKVYGAAGPVADVFSKIGPAATDAADGLYSVSAHLPTLIDRFHFLQDAGSRLRDAFDALNTPFDDLRASNRGLVTEFDNMHDALDTTHHDFNEMGTDWSSATEDGRTLQEQTEATRDAIVDHGIAMLENGHSAEEAAANINSNVQQLNSQWRAAGLTEEQIASLNREYGLTPEQVNTAITLAGAEAAKHTAADYVNYINKVIPGYIETSIKAVPYTANARQAIDALTYSKSVAITPYLTKSELYVSIKATGSAILHSAEGRFVPGGSNMFSSLGEEGGTAGDEVVLPLGNPRRLAQLLGMAQVGPRVAAAMGGGHHEKLVSGYAMSGGGGGDTYINATINMPPGSDGDDVVRVLRKYQRLHGPVPIATR